MCMLCVIVILSEYKEINMYHADYSISSYTPYTSIDTTSIKKSINLNNVFMDYSQISMQYLWISKLKVNVYHNFIQFTIVMIICTS